jgi:hypothetical protein
MRYAQLTQLSPLRSHATALNYGLRNALDNPYDSTGSNPKYTYGGFYVSNLTTALLGDASKGLGVRGGARGRRVARGWRDCEVCARVCTS